MTGPAMTGEAIVAAMRRGDPAAQASFALWLDRLGRGIAGIVNVLDPDVIVLGGGLSTIREIYDALPERVAPHIFGGGFTTPIRPSLHGDASGVRGAAWLWE